MADNATVVFGFVGTFVAAVSGLFAIRQWYLHRSDETLKERTDRQAAERLAAIQERKDDLDRNDEGVRFLIEQLRQEIARLQAEMTTVRSDLKAERDASAEIRADLAHANQVIRAMTADNRLLKERVAMLEGKETADDRADARSEREQDRQDTRDDRRDERERRGT